MDLLDLYLNSEIANKGCEGCTVLNEHKAFHSYMDYETLKQNDVLFLSDCLRATPSGPAPFLSNELSIIKDCSPFTNFSLAAAVKCPSMKDGAMSTKDINICRKHLEKTINVVRPKLVFACGNLALKMLTKKSGITTKRGKVFEHSFEFSDGVFKFLVCPIFHPFSVFKEPKHLDLFLADIQNTYNLYYKNSDYKKDEIQYSVLDSVQKVSFFSENFKDTEETIAIDIETSDLDFKRGSIYTIAFATEKETFVIPWEHFDSTLKDFIPELVPLVNRVTQNKKNIKVFHNSKFDLKFLMRYGVMVENVWDTMLMQHLINEDMPRNLKELIKFYFPESIGKI